jgi:uncharacterized protein (TIGR03435 family)
MRALECLVCASLVTLAAAAQSFEVASVKPSERLAGPDYNNQFTWSSSGLTARNATLKTLVAEAYRVQRRQVFGPAWIDQNEYNIEARAGSAVTKEQAAGMLRALLTERFHLKQRPEDRDLRVYELVIAKSGAKLRPATAGENAKAKPGLGFHFHGDMREFADFLAVKVSMPAPSDPTQPVTAGGPPVPMLDKTGLAGIYDFTVDIRPELGTDGFVLLQRALQDQLGLRMESRKEPVPVLVIDDALKVPTAN